MRKTMIILLAVLAVVMLASCSVDKGNSEENTMSHNTNQDLALLMMRWSWPENQIYLFLNCRDALLEMRLGIHSSRPSITGPRHQSFAPITTFLIKSI